MIEVGALGPMSIIFQVSVSACTGGRCILQPEDLRKHLRIAVRGADPGSRLADTGDHGAGVLAAGDVAGTLNPVLLRDRVDDALHVPRGGRLLPVGVAVWRFLLTNISHRPERERWIVGCDYPTVP